MIGLVLELFCQILDQHLLEQHFETPVGIVLLKNANDLWKNPNTNLFHKCYNCCREKRILSSYSAKSCLSVFKTYFCLLLPVWIHTGSYRKDTVFSTKDSFWEVKKEKKFSDQQLIGENREYFLQYSEITSAVKRESL